MVIQVLETVTKEEERKREKLGSMQPILSSVWHTGQCPVRQVGPREKATLGTRRRRTAKIHRTVRWCTGLSGESSVANSSLSGNRKGDVAIIHRTVRWCTELSSEPTVANATVGRAIRGRRVARSNGRLGTPDSVRCANCLRGPTIGCARKGRRSCTGQLQ
jgi:hypothetical protein